MGECIIPRRGFPIWEERGLYPILSSETAMQDWYNNGIPEKYQDSINFGNFTRTNITSYTSNSLTEINGSHNQARAVYDVGATPIKEFVMKFTSYASTSYANKSMVFALNDVNNSANYYEQCWGWTDSTVNGFGIWRNGENDQSQHFAILSKGSMLAYDTTHYNTANFLIVATVYNSAFHFAVYSPEYGYHYANASGQGDLNLRYIKFGLANYQGTMTHTVSNFWYSLQS